MGLTNWTELWKFNLSSAYRSRLGETSYWNKCAIRFNENVSLMQDLTKSQLERLPLRPEYTVLDIGAGTGRLAIPIANHVKQVTAVEPSAIMFSFLKSNAEKQKTKNIIPINCSCEDMNTNNVVCPHDVVVSSFSLFMNDVVSALQKLDALAKQSVHIFLSASKWITEDLQRIIYGDIIPFISGDYIYVYNILHDLGIFANVEIWDYESTQRFGDLDEAVSTFMDNYRILPNKENVLKQHLNELLVDENGRVCLKRKRKAAMIWWTKK